MSDERPEFTDVYLSASTLWARRWWILAGLALGALGAAAFVFSQPETNRSWAQVLVRPLGVDLTRGAVNMDRAIDPVAERELAGSFVVAERAADRLAADHNPRTLRRNVDIEGVQDSPVLEFSYASTDAERARDITQAFAESYLEVRGELAAVAVGDSRDALGERRAELMAERQQVLEERAELDPDAADADVARAANINAEAVLANRISALDDDLATLGALTSDPGAIISPAQLATASERPRLVPTVLAGAVLGSLLGVIAALFVDRSRRDSERTDDDLRALGLAPIAYVPRESRGIDVYAGLERRVDDLVGANRVVAFATVAGSGPAPQIGPRFAWSLADAGRRVLLVSADFEHHTIARQFGLADGPGLIEALVGRLGPGAVARTVGTLDVVTAGDHPADPAGVLQMVGLRRFLTEARAAYDLIVVSVPQILTHESSLLTIWATDAVTLVIDDESKHQVERAGEVLAKTDCAVLGSVVLTDTSTEAG